LPALFAAMVVVGLGFSLCGGMSFSTVMINWFERQRARALALMQVGKGVGGRANPPPLYREDIASNRKRASLRVRLVRKTHAPPQGCEKKTPRQPREPRVSEGKGRRPT
jgi:hypothetical protein